LSSSFFLDYSYGSHVHPQILIEHGSAEGFSTISHARDYLLNLGRTDGIEIYDDEGDLVGIRFEVDGDKGGILFVFVC
jgi:hypothetical protein